MVTRPDKIDPNRKECYFHGEGAIHPDDLTDDNYFIICQDCLNKYKDWEEKGE